MPAESEAVALLREALRRQDRHEREIRELREQLAAALAASVQVRTASGASS